MPTRRSIRRTALAIAAALASPAAAELPADRELVVTGARIPGLGRVGEFWAFPLAIDDSGRLVAFAVLSDGSAAVVRSAAGTPEVIWRQSTAGADDPVPWFAASSPDGRQVVALGQFAPSGPYYAAAALFDLTDGARIVLATGDRTLDGSVIHGITNVRGVDDAGAILMEALVASGDNPADATIVWDAEGARLITSEDDQAPEGVRVAYAFPDGLLPDGRAVVSGCLRDRAECGIYVGDGTPLEPLLVSGDVGPSGNPIDSASAADVASNGDVLLQTFGASNAYEYARTDAGGALIPVEHQFRLPDGRPFRGDRGRLNARGDVVWSGTVGIAADLATRRDHAVVLRSADGATRRLPRPADGALLNDGGQVAAVAYPVGAQPELVRWSGGDPTTVLSTRSATADGAELFAAGIGAACLADDGRVAFLGRTLGGDSGWVCDDGVAQPVLGRVEEAYPWLGAKCAFAGNELIGLGGGVVTRTDGRRTTRVIAPGDVLPDGTPLQTVWQVAANDRGTLVALDADGHLIRQYRGGDVEQVELSLDDAPVSRVQDAGIAADDTIVALVSPQSGVPALVAHRDGVTTVLDTTDTLGAGHYAYDLLVSGMSAALATIDPDDELLHLTLFDLSTGAGRAILPPEERPDPSLRLYPSYLTPGGELLLTAYGADPFAPAAASWIWRDGAVEVVSDDAAELRKLGRPIALAGSGALLLDASSGVGGALSRLALAGPSATARCPGSSSTASAADGDGCEVGPGDSTSLWPLVLGALLWSARVRAARHRAARRRR